MNHRKLFGTLALLVVLIALFFVSLYLKDQAPATQLPGNQNSPVESSRETVENQEEEISNSETEEFKQFKSDEYGISFMYPSEFGEFTLSKQVTNPEIDRDGSCIASGFTLSGKFSNSNVGVFALSDDYNSCLGRGGSVADYVKAIVNKDSTVTLVSWATPNGDIGGKEKLMATVNTSSNSVGYIYNDTSWGKESNPSPTALIPDSSQVSNLHAVTLTTEEVEGSSSYEDNVEKLKTVITNFKYIN